MHTVKFLDIVPVTHNVRRYRFERPAGYTFNAGQATEAAIDLDGWRDEKRPFTFTGLEDDPYLEFTIKTYESHDGVTKRIGLANPGDTLLIDDPWVTMPYHGPGTFVAGGAGITPLLAVLRMLAADEALAGNRLIFSNTKAHDVILREELEVMSMKGLDLMLTVTDENVAGLMHERLDRHFFEQHIEDFSGWFYLCGPDKMTADMSTALVSLGADPDKVIIAG